MIVIPPDVQTDADIREDPIICAVTVYEREPEPVGLVDITGRPLFRPRERIGFIRETA